MFQTLDGIVPMAYKILSNVELLIWPSQTIKNYRMQVEDVQLAHFQNS